MQEKSAGERILFSLSGDKSTGTDNLWIANYSEAWPNMYLLRYVKK